MILGTPNFGEITGVERTFRHFFGFGRLWGSPGGPKTPRDPSKPRFLMIFDHFRSIFGRFLIDFWTILDQFLIDFWSTVCLFLCAFSHATGSLFRPHNTKRRTQNAAGTVAGMARRPVG